ncbi:MAG: hydroxymethylbilane synthase [Alkaliphilus sp.]|nr:hydroxymethylbilane synthase [Alkaliphilus sp.]
MGERIIKVGSRASALALIQTRWVIDQLKDKFPQHTYEITEIKTMGDKILDKALNKIGDKGLFVKEIEAALVGEDIDFAVHSMKDVPTEMVEKLTIGAITHREDPRDVLISREGLSLQKLPRGAKLGTSSLRRASQLLAFRPDFIIEPIRGNVATRVGKMEELGLDGVILAAAGIIRLGWAYKITEYISDRICVPAVGQGALGIQIRKNDAFMKDLVDLLNNEDVELAVKAERTFMRELKGGCHIPFGAYAYIDEDKLIMKTVLASPDGNKIITLSDEDEKKQWERLGRKMAEVTLNRGGKEILKQLRIGD